MRIYRPVKTDVQTQAFGDSRACVLLSNPDVVVTKTGETCPVGYEDLYAWHHMAGHNGWDHKTWNGEPLYFPVDANTEWWSSSEIDSHGGKGIDVYSTTRIHLKVPPLGTGKLAMKEWTENEGWVYVKFRFWHLKDIVVPDARRQSPDDYHAQPNVVFGKLLGYCDSTGQSSGNHLHWSMKIVAKNSMTLGGDNGYNGAVDFAPDFENVFVLDVLEVKGRALTAIELATKLIFDIKEYLSSNQK